jgi:nitrogen regulatory protein PII
MKMVMMVVDAARREELEVALEEAGVSGYTEIPHAAGLGATGPKLGSRAFPRTSAVIFTFVPDEALEPLHRKVYELCAACGERLRFVVWSAEEMGSAPA